MAKWTRMRYSKLPLWGAGGGVGIFLDLDGKSLSIHYNGEDGGIEYDRL
jgi:hypothetical protein